MRQYQPIWEQIKLHGRATVAADPSLHRRIIQAVRKEKWRDAGHRLLLSENGEAKKLIDEADSVKGLIVFQLVDSSGITVDDL